MPRVRAAIVMLIAALAACVVAAPAGAKGQGAGHSLRSPVTDESFYFVMADRFENGDTANDRGGLPDDRLVSGFDPTRQGLLQRRRPEGPARPDRLHPRARHRLDLADAQLQEQGGPARGRPVGRLPRLLDHRLHADRPAPGHQRRPASADRGRARARHEGLLRHHHQPHGRRDRLRAGRAEGLRVEGRRALPQRLRHAVRRPRLRRHEHVPAAQRGDELPLHARARPGRAEPEGPELAQRPHALPQPRRHDVHRRGLLLRRLLRPRRPLHRAPAGRRGHDRHLQGVDPRLRRRRLPHRHDEARRRRVLAAVRARGARLRPRAGQERVLHVRRGLRHDEELHVALHDQRPDAGRAGLPVPGGGAGLRGRQQAGRRAARLLRRRRLVHRRGLQRLPAADVPRQPRHGPDRPLRERRQRGRERRRAARARPARARADVPLARQPGRLLRRRAGLHRRAAATSSRARPCSPARSPSTSTTT